MLIGQNKNNAIINGRFDYWQRNTSFSTPSNGAYNADRFRVLYDGTIGTFTISQQAFTVGQTDVPNNPQYFLRWNHTAAGSGSTYRQLAQHIEGVENFNGKKATVSFWAKADVARDIGVLLSQRFGSGGSPSANVDTSTETASLTTVWQQFTFSFDIPSISGKTLGTNNNDSVTLLLEMPLNTTMTIDIANVQMVEGSAIGDFELAGHTLAGELALCQRYYEKSYNLSTDPGTVTVNGTHWSQQHTGFLLACGSVDFKVKKRSNPSITFYSPQNGSSGLGAEYNTGGTFISNRSLTTVGVGESGFTAGSADGTFVTNNYNRFHWASNAEL